MLPLECCFRSVAPLDPSVLVPLHCRMGSDPVGHVTVPVGMYATGAECNDRACRARRAAIIRGDIRSILPRVATDVDGFFSFASFYLGRFAALRMGTAMTSFGDSKRAQTTHNHQRKIAAHVTSQN